MAKAKTETTQEITRADSLAAFETLLTVQQTVVEQLEAAKGNSVATQVAKLKGFESLRDAFTTAAMPAVMQIAGTPVGFRTDKDVDGGGTEYTATEVRDVVLDALADGLELFGNQFNIMSKRKYITNEGYTFKVSGIGGVTNLDVATGNPEDIEIQEAPSNNGKYNVFTVYGYVPVIVSFLLHGVPVQMLNTKTADLDGRFQVSASGKDKLKTIDSLKTKGERRARKRLFNFVITAQTPTEPLTLGGDTTPKTEPLKMIGSGGEPEPETKTVVERSSQEWAAAFKEHGVFEQAALLRDAPSAADRETILTASAGQTLKPGAIELLQEYADSRND